MTSYIGLEPTFGTFDKQLITGDGSTATFDLDFPVAQVGQLTCIIGWYYSRTRLLFQYFFVNWFTKITFASAPSEWF